MSSSFEAVNENIYISDWVYNSEIIFPDDELINYNSLDSLRQISNNLIKNNFFVSTAQQTYVNSVIGGTVLPKVRSENKRAEREVTNIIDNFSIGMDINREFDISSIAEQMVNSMFANGDLLINLPIDLEYNGNIKTYVELIEAHRVRTPPKEKQNPLVREGVEYDSSGRIVKYHVVRYRKKNSFNTLYAVDDDFITIPAFGEIDGFRRRTARIIRAPFNLKPLQSRQYPVSTPIMTLLKYFSQYLEAVLIGARVAACFSAFVKTNNPVAAQKSLATDTTITTAPNSGTGKKSKLQPALISYLKPNEDITFASPNRPSDNHDHFVLRLCRFIAAAYRIPYEHYMLDLSITSYSSWRGGSIEVVKNVNRWRRELNTNLLWILDTVLMEAVSKNMISTSLKNVITSIRFPKMKSVDEEKTARANKIELVNGTNSVQRISEESDIDYEELQTELIQETKDKVNLEAIKLLEQKEKAKELGIIFPDSLEAEVNKITKKRPGETNNTDLDEDDAKERRKEDGNW